MNKANDSKPFFIRAILDMKNQRDKLHQYQKRITVITDRERAVAKECLARGDKSKALLALRRRKFQESLLAKTDAQLETLEQLTANVEFSLVQKDVVFGLSQGTKVLKQIQGEMGGLDNVEKLMGENEEARVFQREVSEMLAGQMSRDDEEEVDEELEKMEQAIRGPSQRDRLEEVDSATVEEELPQVPEQEPVYAAELKNKARARARAREQKAAQAFEPMAA